MTGEMLGIARAAHACECSESTLRKLDALGVVNAKRDDCGRRLFSRGDIEVVRAHLARRVRPGTLAFA